MRISAPIWSARKTKERNLFSFLLFFSFASTLFVLLSFCVYLLLEPHTNLLLSMHLTLHITASSIASLFSGFTSSSNNVKATSSNWSIAACYKKQNNNSIKAHRTQGDLCINQPRWLRDGTSELLQINYTNVTTSCFVWLFFTSSGRSSDRIGV